MPLRLKKDLNRAFSLLEVLISVSILSTAIVFVLRAFTTVLSSTKLSQNITYACLLAEDKLWKLENFDPARDFPAEDQKQTKFEFSKNIADAGTDLTSLKIVTLTASWNEGREKPYSTEFVTYLLSK